MIIPQPSRPDLGADLVCCMWRAMEAESGVPRTSSATRVIADIFAQEVQLLRTTLDEHGWPGYRLVGEAGSRAAWQIATYCGDDALQARACDLLQTAVHQQDADPLHYALLADRLCLNQGELQRFGTLYIPKHSGVLELYRVGEPQRLDDRRHALGLGPHAEYARSLQADVLSEIVTAPPS